MSMTQDLIILTYADYLRLKRDLKAAGIDLCYSAEISQPIRLDWALDLFRQEDFLRQIAQRRPADATYRLASVRLSKKGNWFRPDHYAVAFHTVGVQQETSLQQYLAEHKVQSSAETPRGKLTAA